MRLWRPPYLGPATLLVILLGSVLLIARRPDSPRSPVPTINNTRSQSPADRPGTGGEPVIPSTGQMVDTRNAVDIVKAESAGGGEANAPNGPTPLRFMWQESNEALIEDQPYYLATPANLPPLAAVIPASNQMTVGKVALGAQFFFDPRLSLDATVSCASCHDPAQGWTDHRKTSVGIDGQFGSRNAPTILNTIFGRSMFWDGRAPSLEGQSLGPIQNTIEMGEQSYRQIVERLRTIPGYVEQFRKVFGTEVTIDGLAKAIACFERTAISGNSRYDRYVVAQSERDEDEDETTSGANWPELLTLQEKRGMVLFGLPLAPNDPANTQFDAKKLLNRANCATCHNGLNFTDELYHNLGVGYDAATAQFSDLGREVVTPIGSKWKGERGAFKTPTLRDLTRTAPYMHDGSQATLEAVVEFYNKGGTKNPSLDPKMAPLNLTKVEEADLVAFLKTLTGRDIPVPVPTLPAGADGKAPDPRAALNAPGSSIRAERDAVRSGTMAHRIIGQR